VKDAWGVWLGVDIDGVSGGGAWAVSDRMVSPAVTSAIGVVGVRPLPDRARVWCPLMPRRYEEKRQRERLGIRRTGG